MAIEDALQSSRHETRLPSYEIRDPKPEVSKDVADEKIAEEARKAEDFKEAEKKKESDETRRRAQEKKEAERKKEDKEALRAQERKEAERKKEASEARREQELAKANERKNARAASIARAGGEEKKSQEPEEVEKESTTYFIPGSESEDKDTVELSRSAVKVGKLMNKFENVDQKLGILHKDVITGDDMAFKQLAVTREIITQQSAAAIFTQANSDPRGVLSLFQ